MKFFNKLIVLYFSFMIPWIHSEFLQQKMRSILIQSCIFDQLNPVIVSNDLRVLYESWIEEVIPTISIDPNFGISHSSTMFLPKLPTYILSTNQLHTILRNIKSSPWWNIASRFFIIEVDNKCDRAWDALQIMWKMNLLSSIFICQNSNHFVELYTYNPFANYAPSSWQVVSNTFDEKEQQWSLFKQFESQDESSCNYLFFDKTKHLNGSKVIAGAVALPSAPGEFGKIYNASSLKTKLSFTISKPFEVIFSFLNVTPLIYYIDLSDPQNIKNQTFEGLFRCLADGTYDITLNFFTIIDHSDSFDLLYPRYTGTYIILTRHKKVVSSLEQLGSVFGIETIVLSALIFVISLTVFLLCKRLKFVSALLEVLRLILSMNTLSQFFRPSLRIFILSVLMFVMLMNNIYQGQMSAYSTILNREVIDSIADLQTLKYKIYMLRYTGNVLGVDDWSDKHKKYVHFTDFKCFKYVIDSTDSSTSCIFVARVGLSVAMKNNLNVSLITDLQFITSFIRNDWPLKTKVNLIILHDCQKPVFYDCGKVLKSVIP